MGSGRFRGRVLVGFRGRVLVGVSVHQSRPFQKHNYFFVGGGVGRWAVLLFVLCALVGLRLVGGVSCSICRNSYINETIRDKINVLRCSRSNNCFSVVSLVVIGSRCFVLLVSALSRSYSRQSYRPRITAGCSRPVLYQNLAGFRHQKNFDT